MLKQKKIRMQGESRLHTNTTMAERQTPTNITTQASDLKINCTCVRARERERERERERVHV
jgi:hypothetical protein